MRLRLLGHFVVVRSGEAAGSIRLPTRKSGALLAYLAMTRDFTASREELAALLWGDCSEQQARQSLRQALTSLRKQLLPSELSADAKLVRLNAEAWSVDAREFHELAHSSKPDDLLAALRLFTGDFLPHHHLEEEGFTEWVNGERSRLHLAVAHICAVSLARPELVLDARETLAAADQLVALDPLREDWQRLALMLSARYRGRHDALARGAALTALLQRELGAEPEDETAELLARLRRSDEGPAALSALQSENEAKTSPPERRLLPPVPEQLAETPLPPAALQVHERIDRSARVPTALAAAVAVLLCAGAALELDWLRFTGKSSANLAVDVGAAKPDPWQSPLSSGQAIRANGIVPVLVLPLKGFGDNDEQVQLTTDMLTDDLTNTLSRVPSFRVISQQTARTFRDQPLDLAKIGRELQVRYVLAGTVRLYEGRLRVNIELVDPATQLSVWSNRVERGGADRQGVRDEIVARLARELQFDVLPIESARLSDSSAAALAYKGWAALSQVRLGGYEQAVALFNEALEKDPQNLSAKTGIGAYHARMGAQVLDTDPLGHRKKAVAILREVLVQAPESSQAHFYLALALNLLPTLPEAMEHFERAISIDPSDASAHGQIGNALIRSGRAAEGLEHVRYAMRLSPRDPIMPVWLEFAGNAELELQNFAEAEQYFQRSIGLNSGYPRSWAGLAAAYALEGRAADASKIVGRLRDFAPDLSDEALTRQFGRHPGSRLRAGLKLAVADAAP